MHLKYRTLSAYADGEVGEASLAAVQAHLAACAECRDELRFIRALGEALRDLPSPTAPRDFVDEIFPAGSGQGDAVPLFGPSPPAAGYPRRRWALSLAAGLAVLMALCLALTVGADRAMAGSSTMTLTRTGEETLTVRYETMTPLSAEPGLRARIRYWIPDSLRFTETTPGYTTAELNREEAGTFVGVATLPPGAVYAMAAVEDPGGTRIDTNRGRFWEYIESDEHGRPTLQGRLYQLIASEVGAGDGRQADP